MDFKQFYITWFSRCVDFAFEYVRDRKEAENIVQDAFCKIYERWDMFDEGLNVSAYLFVSVKNGCLNYLKNVLRRNTGSINDLDSVNEYKLSLKSIEEFDVAFSNQEAIEQRLYQALDKLPPKCREIFLASKMEGKRHKDIAEELDISVNTVESQMGIAYRKLRDEMKDCLPLLLFLIIT